MAVVTRLAISISLFYTRSHPVNLYLLIDAHAVSKGRNAFVKVIVVGFHGAAFLSAFLWTVAIMIHNIDWVEFLNSTADFSSIKANTYRSCRRWFRVFVEVAFEQYEEVQLRSSRFQGPTKKDSIEAKLEGVYCTSKELDSWLVKAISYKRRKKN